MVVLAASVAPAPASPLSTSVVRAETGLRALWRGAIDQLFEWADAAPPVIPDLAVLATEPVRFGEPSDFGWRSDPFRHTPRYHSGADFRGHPGTPIVAAGDGIVVFAGWFYGYGKVVEVDHGGGVLTRYAHMRKIVTQKGAAVTAGTQLGEMGATGRATGTHLHFEVRIDGRAVDPVMALTVGELERVSPQLGKLASFALVPELQPSPTGKPGKRAARPERAGRVKRTQALW